MPERLQPFTEGLADPPEATVTEIPPVLCHLSRDDETSVHKHNVFTRLAKDPTGGICKKTKATRARCKSWTTSWKVWRLQRHSES